MIPATGTLSDLRMKINASLIELGVSGGGTSGTISSSVSRLHDMIIFTNVKVSLPKGTLANAVLQYNALMFFKNWPPSSAPSWPPVELNTTWLSCSGLKSLNSVLNEHGFTRQTPTTGENNLFFDNVRCKQGHAVTGMIFMSPLSVRYPFAVCNNSGHRDFLVLWPPYYAGWGSGVE